MRKKYNAGETQRSGAHRRVEKFLIDMGINFESEVEFPPFCADIYLPEWHLILEVDGPFHSKVKDVVRDKFMRERFGLETLRINAKVWMLKSFITSNILSFIEEHADSAPERKLRARSVT